MLESNSINSILFQKTVDSTLGAFSNTFGGVDFRLQAVGTDEMSDAHGHGDDEPGHHVNLVTHGANGHPSEYLYESLDDSGVTWEYVQQCGCGRHVTRVCVG